MILSVLKQRFIKYNMNKLRVNCKLSVKQAPILVQYTYNWNPSKIKHFNENMC
jgi:hypothetical protein